MSQSSQQVAARRPTAWVYPVLAFYLLAFGITHLTWGIRAIPSDRILLFDVPPYVAGGLAPGVAAIVVIRRLRGAEGVQTCSLRCCGGG
jgi:hypothetical protein